MLRSADDVASTHVRGRASEAKLRARRLRGRDIAMGDDEIDAIAAAAAAALPLHASDTDYTPLVDSIGDAQFVLLGECTHGTAEFYRHRAAITQALIEKKGFSIVLVEGDWPACYRLNQYVTSAESADSSAQRALQGFEGFPRWMWRNSITAELAEALRSRNTRVRAARAEHSEADSTVNSMRAAGATEEQLKEMGFSTDAAPPLEVSFYGMDTYSVNASAEAVIEFLEVVDPEAADRARACYSHVAPFGDDMKKYGFSVVLGELRGLADTIQDDLLSTLAELQRQNRETYDLVMGPAELLNAEQNAQVVVNGESYFRGLFEEGGGGVNTWNLRDQHMVQTCLRLVEFHQIKCDGRPPKVVLWAHNSHVGDARATDRAAGEEWNLGQMMRTTFGEDSTYLVGFGTHSGSVTAAVEWGAEAQTFELNEAEAGSYSDILHSALPIVRDRLGVEGANLNDVLLLIRAEAGRAQEARDGADEKLTAMRKAFGPLRRQRAIGVRYQKEREDLVHYVNASLASQFDAWIHVDRSTALEPL